jgi:hypothetical protein
MARTKQISRNVDARSNATGQQFATQLIFAQYLIESKDGSRATTYEREGGSAAKKPSKKKMPTKKRAPMKKLATMKRPAPIKKRGAPMKKRAPMKKPAPMKRRAPARKMVAQNYTSSEEEESSEEESSDDECEDSTYSELASICANLAGHFHKKAKASIAATEIESEMESFTTTASKILAHFEQEELISLNVSTPSGQQCRVEVKKTNTILTLKTVLAEQLGVPASHQLLLPMLAAPEAADADEESTAGGAAASSTASDINPCKMKVVDLRAELKRIGHDTTGLKAVLVKRLEECIAGSTPAGAAAHAATPSEEDADIFVASFLASDEDEDENEDSEDEDDGDEDDEDQEPFDNALTVVQCGLSNGSALSLIVDGGDGSLQLSDDELEPETSELEAVIAAGYPDALTGDDNIPLAALLSRIDVSQLSLWAEEQSDDDGDCDGGMLPKAARLVLHIDEECVSDMVRESSYFQLATKQLERENALEKVAGLARLVGEHEVCGLQGSMYRLELSTEANGCSVEEDEDRDVLEQDSHYEDGLAYDSRWSTTRSANVTVKLLLRSVSHPAAKAPAAVTIEYSSSSSGTFSSDSCNGTDRESFNGSGDVSIKFYSDAQAFTPIQRFDFDFDFDGHDDFDSGELMSESGYTVAKDREDEDGEGGSEEGCTEQTAISHNLREKIERVLGRLWSRYGSEWCDDC